MAGTGEEVFISALTAQKDTLQQGHVCREDCLRQV